MSEARVIAHPNIALAKYWGKLPGDHNLPAVPSLSITLGDVATRTRVRFREDLTADRLILNGEEAHGGPLLRASQLLERVRATSGERRFAEVESSNDFPTASGLASSASGFAALAMAATCAARGVGSERAHAVPTASEISVIARRSSASAARSAFGGYVELPAGTPGDGSLAARPVADARTLDLRVLLCVTTDRAKQVGSTDGMRATAEASPYYASWVDDAPRLFLRLRNALLASDFLEVGRCAEASALAMHACAIAGGLVYWNGVTVEALAAVRALRAQGIAAYATIDAGPHVKVLVRPGDAERVAQWMREVPGVLRVITCAPGEGARLENDVSAPAPVSRSRP